MSHGLRVNIWLGVRLYFGAQAAVVERRRGPDALRRSSELVKGQWWRTFGVLFVTGFCAAVMGLAVGLGIGGPLALLTDLGVLLATATILGEAIAVSFTALVATLLFFDLRVRSLAQAPKAATVSFTRPRPFDDPGPA